MIPFRLRVLSSILVLFVFTPALTGAFVHPKQLIKSMPPLAGKVISSPFNVLDITVGSHPMATYGTQESAIGGHYGFIHPQGISYRFDFGYFSNKNNSGASLKTIPAMMNVLLGYPVQARIDSYVGVGAGLMTFQDAVSKIGFGYQWFSGLTVGLTPDMSLFTEYGRQYCSIDNQNYDAELVSFGLTFRFVPR